MVSASQKRPPLWNFHLLQYLESTKNGALKKKTSIKWHFCEQRHLVKERGQIRMARLFKLTGSKCKRNSLVPKAHGSFTFSKMLLTGLIKPREKGMNLCEYI